MNNQSGISSLDDIILSVCLLSEQDKKWIISNLSDQQQRQLQARLAVISADTNQWTAVQHTDLTPAINSQVNEMRSLLVKAMQTNREALLALFNDEPSWVRAYLLGRFPQLFKDALKDSALKNKWSNVTGMDSIYRGLLTDRSCMAINEAIIQKLNDMSIKYQDNSGKKFTDYLDARS